MNLCEKSWEAFLTQRQGSNGLAANVLWFTEALLHKLLRKGRISPGLVLLPGVVTLELGFIYLLTTYFQKKQKNTPAMIETAITL